MFVASHSSAHRGNSPTGRSVHRGDAEGLTGAMLFPTKPLIRRSSFHRPSSQSTISPMMQSSPSAIALPPLETSVPSANHYYRDDDSDSRLPYRRTRERERGRERGRRSQPAPSSSSYRRVCGVLAADKPRGFTCMDVVNKVRGSISRGLKEADREGEARIRIHPNDLRAERRKTRSPDRYDVKVGHGGTLDPFATGVVVLGVGEATKHMQTFLQGDKSYRAVGLLGIATDTLDSDGEVVSRSDWESVTADDLRAAMKRFEGPQLQTPPMFSAKKVNGTRMYELARRGEAVYRDPVQVTIKHLQLTDTSQLPYFEFEVTCSGGTYIRTLCEDIARSCGTEAHLTELQRTEAGGFVLDDALPEPLWSLPYVSRAIRPVVPVGMGP
ncbi:unnamed protein product [Vitrella brassicaformis CCMP3155]|uniref:tRNA pseudouridine(55) synthase n=1 Tax=Vitrella brassicaformis (strain CCMP3155) TaxID=1169540 RepID=A0A0G4H463_VITBC|nr:unnamed protein product [Vitrella brassicaformis CCMP3155]|eukprot:CEM38540.1 unnamed protein product [Vitrella brassicaformis CCMP3155]